VIRVVSVYCPTNLDRASTYFADRVRKAANDMVDAAVRWATQAEVCFIGGDFNESATVDDRRMGGEAAPLEAERLARNTINSVVLHPGTGLADVHAFVNGSTRAFTRSDYRGGAARLDYIFASHQWLERVSDASCIVDPRFQSDHMMVCAAFQVPNIVPRPEQREAKRWSPTYLNIQRARHSRLVKWRDQVIGLCEHFLPKAESALARDKLLAARDAGGDAYREAMVAVGEAQKWFASRVLELAEQTWGRKSQKPRKSKTYRSQRSQISALRTMLDLHGKMTKGELVTGTQLSRAREYLGRVGLPDPPLHHGDEAGWSKWSTWAAAEISRVKYAIKADRRAMDAQQCRSREHLFYGSQSQKKFNERYLRPQTRFTLDSAKLPSGVRTYDPAKYMTEIDRQAGKAFLNRVRMPAAAEPWHSGRVRRRQQAGCDWSDKEKLRKHFQDFESLRLSHREAKPPWWHDCYEAKVEEKKEWGDIMGAISMQDLLDAVKRVETGKSPGHDRLSVDMLKYLFWGKEGPDMSRLDISWDHKSQHWVDAQSLQANAAARVVLLLCNATVALGQVPTGMKLGEIVYLPKMSASGVPSIDVEDMRPITLLPELGKITNRILAARLTEALTRHPDLLDPAQRGFLRDGSTTQYINTVLDIFEDHHEKKGKPLFVLSYDLKKAFDSVQEYGLRAALNRAGLPPSLSNMLVPCLPLLVAGLGQSMV
jgi:hypothetical protein